MTVLLPGITALLALAFSAAVFDQWLRKRQAFQLIWAAGMLFFAIASGCETIAAASGWNETLYKTWYLTGAVWTAGWLGLGTCFLLGRTRFGYAVALSLFLAGLFTFLAARRAGLAMVDQPEGGCIVNFGDWAEARPYTGYAAYFATKGAIPTLTRSLAVELGTRNPRVRVNAILPGPAMMPESVPEAERRAIVEATLARREGRPEDIARAVLYLVESEFVTGTCLVVDGGRTVFAGDH